MFDLKACEQEEMEFGREMGRQLHKMRMDLKLSARDVFYDTGVSPTTLKKIESGNPVYIKHVFRLSRYYGRRIRMLFD